MKVLGLVQVASQVNHPVRCHISRKRFIAALIGKVRIPLSHEDDFEPSSCDRESSR